MNYYKQAAPHAASSTASPGFDVQRNDDLKRKLECPVCFNTCLPPIYMCLNGHNVCAKCSEQVTECAICRAPGRPTIRNIFAEEICAQIKLPCENRDEECQGMFTVAELKEHLPTCHEQFSYRCHLPEPSVNAPNLGGVFKNAFPGMNQPNVNYSSFNMQSLATQLKIPPRFLHGFLQNTTVTPCEWIGNRVDLLKHVETSHSEWLTRGFVADMSMLVQDAYSYQGGVQGDTRLMTNHGQLFWCFLQYNQELSAIVGHVTYVGGKKAAGRYRYMMKVASADGEQRLEFQGKMLELEDEEMNQGDQRKKMFYVFRDAVEAYAVNGALKCRVEIEETNLLARAKASAPPPQASAVVFEDVEEAKLLVHDN